MLYHSSALDWPRVYYRALYKYCILLLLLLYSAKYHLMCSNEQLH